MTDSAVAGEAEEVLEADPFLRWIVDLYGEEPGPDSDEEALAWFRSVFDSHGPVTWDELDFHYLCSQLEATEVAVALLMVDLSVVSDELPEFEVDAFEAVRVLADGGIIQPAVYAAPWDEANTVEQLVSNVQSAMQLEDRVTWPMCLKHDLAELKPVVERDAAHWHCPAGDHLVARIGDIRRGTLQRAHRG